MIANIKGVVLKLGEKFVIIDVSGIGYKVFVSPDLISKLETGQEISFFTYLAVRENALDLYGFLHYEELELFELLLTISGIGPKGALGVLAQASPAEIKESIVAGESRLLVKVSGIGKKTAERIVLELKNKIGGLERNKGLTGMNNTDLEVLEALEALGYSIPEAREALKKTDKELAVSEKIKQALKFLAK